MVYLRGCPKCHGALFDEFDHYGKRVLCINCGYSIELIAAQAVMLLVEEAGIEHARRGRKPGHWASMPESRKVAIYANP